MLNLRELIAWLEQQNPDTLVPDGFDAPHCDRGHYQDIAFDPIAMTTFGEMLRLARSAVGATFEGWKGGEFTMSEWTNCHIGVSGECGEEITSATLRLWLLTARRPGGAATGTG